MKVKAYRKGHVVVHKVANLGCCHLSEVDKPLFNYIEVVYEDDSRKYFYEDEEGLEKFFQNFHSKRFTSYHEFFTTDQLAIEKRGMMELKYFVRHDKDSYEKVSSLEQKEQELAEYLKEGAVSVRDRVTVYGKYDTQPNDHWDEEVPELNKPVCGC